MVVLRRAGQYTSPIADCHCNNNSYSLAGNLQSSTLGTERLEATTVLPLTSLEETSRSSRSQQTLIQFFVSCLA